MRRSVAILVLLVAALLAGPAAASAATTLGAGTDDTGDAEGGADLTAAAVRYDDAGTLVGAVTFASAPAAGDDGLVLVFLGTVDGSACSATVAIGGPVAGDSPPSEWAEPDAQGDFQTTGAARREADGLQVRFTASGDRLGGRRFDCAYAVLASPDLQGARDGVGGFLLTQEQPPPTTTTAPTTTTTPPATTQQAPPATTAQTAAAPAPRPLPTPTPAPAATPTPAAAVAVAKAIKRTGAHLKLALPTVRAGKRGVTRAVRITVRNRGTRTAVRPVVRLTPPAGVTVRPRTVELASIAEGKRRSATVRLRVGAKVKATGTVRVSVRTRTKGTRRTASAKLGLPVKQPAPPKAPAAPAPGAGGAPTTPATPAPAAATSLAGRYYFWLRVDVTTGQNEDAVYFVDGQWAYRGVPEDGLPTCTQRTAGTDERGNPTDGCVPYAFDPATKALTIDGQPVAITPTLDALTIGDREYPVKPIVPAGSRFDVDLKSIRQTGIAPFNATVSTLYLTLRSSGEFSLTSESIGSFGIAPGAPGSGNFYASHPDQAGTWSIPTDGKLVLSYADGHTDTWTIAIDRDPETGGVDPAVNGLLLSDRFFFKDDGD